MRSGAFLLLLRKEVRAKARPLRRRGLRLPCAPFPYPASGTCSAGSRSAGTAPRTYSEDGSVRRPPPPQPLPLLLPQSQGSESESEFLPSLRVSVSRGLLWISAFCALLPSGRSLCTRARKRRLQAPLCTVNLYRLLTTTSRKQILFIRAGAPASEAYRPNVTTLAGGRSASCSSRF